MLDFTRQSPRTTFCLLLRVITILIALQQWESSILGPMGQVSANSQGEMVPTSISILIGANATMRCTIPEANSSNIWFREGISHREIRQPSKEIEIIDDYTVLLVLRNATAQISSFACMIGKRGIGTTIVNVGTKPTNVMDFSCLGMDYKYLLCRFTAPKNMLLTNYSLEYNIDDSNISHVCDLTELDYSADIFQCNTSYYLPVRSKYVFTLVGINAGGENLQTFTINNHEVVVPATLDIDVIDVNSENATLSWVKQKFGYYRWDFRYDIRIRDNNSSWHIPEMGDVHCQHEKCKMLLKNLYPYWQYMVKVRIMSKKVPANDERLWSEPSTKSFRTLGRRPYRAPDTPLGSFYIDSPETQLRLYWGRLDESDHCGPGFHYVVDEIDRNGVVIQRVETNETTLAMPWKNNSQQIFSINSANDFGESSVPNKLHVYRSSSHQYELNENNIAKVYHNSSYTLSWTHPEKIDDLLNYTVFWCLPQIELPNQCKGPISYKYLEKYRTNFTTEPKDRSLNLAISANYLNYNKGMQWARCSGEVSSELMKAELEVSAINESAIFVKWSSGSVCSSILKGYNLSYCQASDENHCLEPKKTIQRSRDHRNYTLTDLQPYRKVCVSLYMFSHMKRGVDSELCVRTKQSAPSSPKNLQLTRDSITSESAAVTWKHPDLSNGILSHYTIYWFQSHGGSLQQAVVPINQTSFKITGLNSSTTYDVEVTASTIKESLPSERIQMSTLVGYPSIPRNIQIDENDKIISWEKPDIPPGRELFYLVALLRHHNQNETNYERVSIVRGLSCKFQLPDCSNPKESLALEVRAIDVANHNETDLHVSSMSQEEILAGAKIVESFCESDYFSPQELFFQDRSKIYLASPWEQARKYFCFSGSKASIYGVAFVIAIAFCVYTCYWLRNKYTKMKNIKVILPEGLVDQVSNYKFNGNSMGNGCNLDTSEKKEFHSDISRSNDCLVAFGHKDTHNLITSFHNSTLHTSQHSPNTHRNDDQVGDHPSLETTNEELSSNSSSNSNLTYNNHPHGMEQLSSMSSTNTLPISADDDERRISEQDNEFSADTKECTEQNNKQVVNIDGGGYVTHNTQLLASLLNDSSVIVPQPTFPAMTNDGYIQPSAAKQLFQPQLSTQTSTDAPTFTGYTSIEALDKLSPLTHGTAQNHTLTSHHPTMADSLNRCNLSINKAASQTSPVIADFPELDHNKDPQITSPNTPVSATCPTLQPNNNNNNNNNSIYGYVTQQQLAKFGTNVALGRELNT